MKITAAEMRDVFERKGGESVWSIRGDFGRIELWAFEEGCRILQTLPSKAGIHVFEQLADTSIEELLK